LRRFSTWPFGGGVVEIVEFKRGGQVIQGKGEELPAGVLAGTVQRGMFGIEVTHEEEVIVGCYPLEKVHVDVGGW
jgi:hypothetical protein